MVQLSEHALWRAARRNVSAEEIEYVRRYGTRLHRAGVIFYYLRWRDLPQADRRDGRRAQLVGTAVVLNRHGGLLVTVWRNRRDGYKRIKRKSKYNRPELDPEAETWRQ